MERLIKVYLLNIEKLEEKADILLPEIAPYYAEKYKKAKAPGVKRQELGAGYILRKCLGVKADKELEFGAMGKPSLNKENIDSDMEFNLSHSGKYVALAVSDKPVGIDIERINRITLPVLKRVLPPDYYRKTEEEVQSKIAGEDEKYILGKSWTALEAVLKASGTGFVTDDYNKDDFFDGWHVESMEIEDEYVISCASGSPFKLSVNMVEL